MGVFQDQGDGVLPITHAHHGGGHKVDPGRALIAAAGMQLDLAELGRAARVDLTFLECGDEGFVLVGGNEIQDAGAFDRSGDRSTTGDAGKGSASATT